MGFPAHLLRPLLLQHRLIPQLTLSHPRSFSPSTFQAAPKPKAASSSAAASKPKKAAAASKPKKAPLANKKSPNGTEDSDEDMAGSDVDDFEGKSSGAPTPGAKGLGKDIEKELGGQAGKGKNASQMYQKVSHRPQADFFVRCASLEKAEGGDRSS